MIPQKSDKPCGGVDIVGGRHTSHTPRNFLPIHAHTSGSLLATKGLFIANFGEFIDNPVEAVS